MNKNIQNYQAIDILGKTLPELVVKIYEGAVSHLTKGMEYYRSGKMQDGFEATENAKKFVVHLYASLDNEKGGDIAKNLSRLYAFIVERINFAQATKDLKSLEDSILILNNIKDGWAQLAAESKSKNLETASAASCPPSKRVSISA
jgi:flagellar protein FliS